MGICALLSMHAEGNVGAAMRARLGGRRRRRRCCEDVGEGLKGFKGFKRGGKGIMRYRKVTYG